MDHVQVSANISIGILGQYFSGALLISSYSKITALQGAFAEHQAALQKISCQKKLAILLVRTAEDLSACDALIIPGGGETSVTGLVLDSHHPLESTTIALLAKLSGLLEPLRAFVQQKPVWGTCAGAILLAQAVENTKKGGQELLGGISVTVARNGWGSQV